MRVCIVLLLTLVLSSCIKPAEPIFSPVESNLKVITYNVNWGGAGVNQIINYLDKADADVVFLQETNKQWEYYLTKHLNYRYQYSVFKESQGAGGIAFLSKYEIKNIKFIKPVGWFPGLKADIKTPFGLVQILNVHLRPPLSERGTPILSALYNSSKRHRIELDHFLKETVKDIPLIIAGDFNEEESDKAIVNLVKKGFTDSLSIYDRSSNTGDGRFFRGLRLKVDMIISYIVSIYIVQELV
ncbi:MAG: hypothetical protein GY760_25105 [Deltaproteobacteria bacterium]|nr:hypothetical protein [Deltaproteobacteria bacterium]